MIKDFLFSSAHNIQEENMSKHSRCYTGKKYTSIPIFIGLKPLVFLWRLTLETLAKRVLMIGLDEASISQQSLGPLCYFIRISDLMNIEVLR